MRTGLAIRVRFNSSRYSFAQVLVKVRGTNFSQPDGGAFERARQMRAMTCSKISGDLAALGGDLGG
jgi:hypothetical protein